MRLVVYSTCSIFYEENERVVEVALNMVPNFKLLSINDRLKNKLNLMPFPTYQSDVQLNDNLQRVRDKCLNLRYDTDLTKGFFIALLKRRKNGYVLKSIITFKKKQFLKFFWSKCIYL